MPRKCNVNRLEGKRGYCGMDSTIRAARAALHMWEEPCISGKKDQGLFFSLAAACGAVSARTGILPLGILERISVERLAEIFWNCRKRGGKSESGHWGSLCAAYYFGVGAGQRKGNESSVVYNSSGYESVEKYPGDWMVYVDVYSDQI